jgi:uncharacterized DUF497 family protein
MVPDDELLFDWDNANTTHIERHKVNPMEAEQVLRNDPFDLNYEVAAGEQRWTSIGHTDKLRILIVVWAIRSGAANAGGPQRVLTELRQLKNITIRLRLDDLARARALAERKGVGYQTYMKMLLHEALERESQKARRA